MYIINHELFRLDTAVYNNYVLIFHVQAVCRGFTFFDPDIIRRKKGIILYD